MQVHSSTSSSNWIRSTLWWFAGLVVTLTAFEITVNTLFSIPEGAQQPSGSLEKYFNYGLSTESKLDRTVGESGSESAAIIRAGWIPTELYGPDENWQDAPHRVIFYGMSFTNRAADHLAKLMPTASICTRAGPGAPFNHSYAMFQSDPYRDQADTVVIGILSSSLPYMQTISGISYSFESPSPFAFPKYESHDGKTIDVTNPIIQSRDEFIEAYREQTTEWDVFKDQLRIEDAFWDGFVFNESITDRSALFRLARRAWASKQADDVRSNIYTSSGYDLSQPSLSAVPLLISDIQDKCLQNNQRLIILLLHARGEPGHLDAWLTQHLKTEGTQVISTHEIFDSTDAMNFLGDGHYIPQRDAEIAEKIQDLIQTQ